MLKHQEINPDGKRVLDNIKMTKDLTEIVTKDNLSLRKIIERAMRMQGRKEEINQEGISRKTLYDIASEVGIGEEDIEKAIEEEKNNYDNIYVCNEEIILDLARRLNLKDKEEEIDDKKRRVHQALIKILKQEKKFKPKIYTREEIDTIFRKKEIVIDPTRIIEQGFKLSSRVEYKFSELIDNKGNKKYQLYKNSYSYE